MSALGVKQWSHNKEIGYWALAVAPCLFLAILYLYPIGQILWISFSSPSLGLQNYAQLLHNAALQRMLVTTVRVCFFTTVLAMFFGYLVAYAMVNVTDRQRKWMLLFVLVPFWVSVLVRAFCWIALLRPNGVVNSVLVGIGVLDAPVRMVRNEFGVVVGMTHYMLPYAILPLFANMRGIDQSLVAAARGLGASPLAAFTRVFLPLSLPGVLAAGTLVFILALGFFVTPALLGGGKTIMIAEHVSLQIRMLLNWGMGAMVSTVLLVTVLALLGGISRVVTFQQLFVARR
jgi:putative spermidine/putrescine transport system permease protein